MSNEVIRRSKRVREQQERPPEKKKPRVDTSQALSDRNSFAKARAFGLRFHRESWQETEKEKEEWQKMFDFDIKLIAKAQANVLIAEFRRLLRFRGCDLFQVDSHKFLREAFALFLARLDAAGMEYTVSGEKLDNGQYRKGCKEHDFCDSNQKWCVHFASSESVMTSGTTSS